MTFAVVSTCSAAGYAQYGHRMVKGLKQYWPADVLALLYSEDVLPVRTEPFPQWFVEWKARHANDPAAHGKRRGHDYTYVRDCVRFAHKVAAVTDAALTLDADVLIWLDADTVTHAPVTTDWLKGLLPQDCYIGWLDRVRPPYPECGFYMLSLKHPMHAAIMARWIELYTSDEILTWPETHDCVSLQKVIHLAEKAGEIKVHSLSGEAGRRSVAPFIHAPISTRLDHPKGPRKKIGRTPKHERSLKDATPYWQ